jgi:hypothetical protein
MHQLYSVPLIIHRKKTAQPQLEEVGKNAKHGRRMAFCMLRLAAMQGQIWL